MKNEEFFFYLVPNTIRILFNIRRIFYSKIKMWTWQQEILTGRKESDIQKLEYRSCCYCNRMLILLTKPKIQAAAEEKKNTNCIHPKKKKIHKENSIMTTLSIHFWYSTIIILHSRNSPYKTNISNWVYVKQVLWLIQRFNIILCELINQVLWIKYFSS